MDWPAPNERRLASGAPGPAYWQQRCDYRIDATLNTDNGEVAASEVVTYHNNSPHDLAFVWLNLDQNRSRRDSKGNWVHDGKRYPEGESVFGDQITNVGDATIASPAHGASDQFLPGPIEASLKEYGTIARLDLSEPIPPGGVLSFRLDWTLKISGRGTGRHGIRKDDSGTVYELAFWFPNVCVYNDARGWNTLPFLGRGEFYTDFGDYDVRLTVPRDHIVAATGVLQNPGQVLTSEQIHRLDLARHSTETVTIIGKDEAGTEQVRPVGDGPLTWHFRAEDVRTFAWASGDALLWDASFLPDSGPAGHDGTPTGTLVQSFYPKEALPLWSKATRMLADAIAYYNERWFVYPYPVASNVNGRGGGMEYPMVIFCGSRGGNEIGVERGLFGLIAHEIGHNWFPMVVNTDERRHAWQDEGLNTYINYAVNREQYPDAGPRRGDSRRGDFIKYMRLNQKQPIMTRADWVHELGRVEYDKVATGLVLLRNEVLGPERYDEAFRTYIERWAFKSPRPADFFRCIEDVSGEELSWFWRGWFYSTDALDQAVETVNQEEDAPVRVTIASNGMVMPVVFKATYDDGTDETIRLPAEVWYDGDHYTAVWDTGGRKLVKVEIDPEGVFPDIDATNNVWPR